MDFLDFPIVSPIVVDKKEEKTYKPRIRRGVGTVEEARKNRPVIKGKQIKRNKKVKEFMKRQDYELDVDGLPMGFGGESDGLPQPEGKKYVKGRINRIVNIDL